MESHIEDKKYYVPEISEFHVGFEYECKLSQMFTNPPINKEDEGFTKLKFSISTVNVNELSIIESHIKNQAVRIKYLDREDIESLGFKYKDVYRDGGTIEFKSLTHNLKYYRDNIIANSPNKIIINNGKIVVFEGDVKNKSELVNLMNKLGINN